MFHRTQTLTNRKDRDLLSCLDAPLSLELLQDPLGPKVAHPVVPLIVVFPNFDRNLNDPLCQLLGRALVLVDGLIPCLFDSSEGFEEVDGRGAGG